MSQHISGQRTCQRLFPVRCKDFQSDRCWEVSVASVTKAPFTVEIFPLIGIKTNKRHLTHLQKRFQMFTISRSSCSLLGKHDFSLLFVLSISTISSSTIVFEKSRKPCMP